MRKYYAGYSHMGTQYTYASPCWTAKVFESKKSRDEWVVSECKSGNDIAEMISAKTAYKIAGIKAHYVPFITEDGVLIAVPDNH